MGVRGGLRTCILPDQVYSSYALASSYCWPDDDDTRVTLSSSPPPRLRVQEKNLGVLLIWMLIWLLNEVKLELMMMSQVFDAMMDQKEARMQIV